MSETRFSLSFFLTTPAKKPRTECCCQSVAFMIAAIVAPFGCRNNPSTVSCFNGALGDPVEARFRVLDSGVGFDSVVPRFFAPDPPGRDFLLVCLADFDLGL